MAFSNNMQKVTDKLTKKFGDTVTLVEIIQGAYNTATGSTTDVEIEHTVKGVIQNYLSNELVAGVVNIDDLKCLIYASSFDISKKWNVRYRGAIWNVINIAKLSTQDTLIYYELQIRSK